MSLQKTTILGFLAMAIMAVGAGLAKAERVIDGIKVEVLADGLEHPWGLAQLPDGSWLITERPGRVRHFADGALSEPLEGAPETREHGQGGLLDVALDPNFTDNNLVYFSFSDFDGSGNSGTAIARARLSAQGDAPRLEETETIYSMPSKTGARQHFGSRIVFQDDDTLWFGIGDRGEMDRAQVTSDPAGSIMRIRSDGSIPEDNPFIGQDGYLPEMWSVGHRNPQGAFRHPETGALWSVEHGPRGGDELNIPQAGLNYGWPVISYGEHYSGGQVGVGTEAPGMEQPIHYWDPALAPSGMLFYQGDLFPDWRGNVFIGGLRPQKLVRLVMDGENVAEEHDHLQGLGRIRAVEEGIDGAIYLLTDDGNGQLIRLSPAN